MKVKYRKGQQLIKTRRNEAKRNKPHPIKLDSLGYCCNCD